MNDINIKDRILETGAQIWACDPKQVTSRKIAERLSISHAHVWYYYKSNEILQSAIAEYAVKMKKSAVIVSLIAQNHAAVSTLTDDEKREYLNSIVPKKS